MAQTLDRPAELDAPLAPCPPFGCAPALPAAWPAAPDTPAPRRRPPGRVTFGLYDSAVLLLVLGSAALGAYRLWWAIQP